MKIVKGTKNKDNVDNVDNLQENHKEFIKNKLLLKWQRRFRSGKHSVFTGKVNKIALSANNDEKINQSIQ